MAQGVPTPYPDLAPREGKGKPTLCTPAVIGAIAAAVRDGMYPGSALDAAGISATSHSYWVQRALEDDNAGLDDSIYCQYSRAVKIAEADAEAEMIKTVREAAHAGPQYWPAGMTMLERRHPDRWGKRERVDPPTHNTSVKIVFVQAGDHSRVLESVAQPLQDCAVDTIGPADAQSSTLLISGPNSDNDGHADGPEHDDADTG